MEIKIQVYKKLTPVSAASQPQKWKLSTAVGLTSQGINTLMSNWNGSVSNNWTAGSNWSGNKAPSPVIYYEDYTLFPDEQQLIIHNEQPQYFGQLLSNDSL
jgi:hypothetical protein